MVWFPNKFRAFLMINTASSGYLTSSRGFRVTELVRPTRRRLQPGAEKDFFSAYLCVPLRLCGKCARTTCLPQRRRGTQRYAEKIRHHPEKTAIEHLQMPHYNLPPLTTRGLCPQQLLLMLHKYSSNGAVAIRKRSIG